MRQIYQNVYLCMCICNSDVSRYPKIGSSGTRNESEKWDRNSTNQIYMYTNHPYKQTHKLEFKTVVHRRSINTLCVSTTT